MLICIGKLSFGQYNHEPLDLSTAPKPWIDAINKKYTKFVVEDNFLVYKRVSRLLKRNSEMPIHIQMFKGRLYHFLVFTDPTTERVELKLGKRGVGHIVTDKFFPKRDGEFFTEFSYVCSKDGIYLLTLFQKAKKRKLLTHIAVLQKERKKDNVKFGY